MNLAIATQVLTRLGRSAVQRGDLGFRGDPTETDVARAISIPFASLTTRSMKTVVPPPPDHPALAVDGPGGDGRENGDGEPAPLEHRPPDAGELRSGRLGDIGHGAPAGAAPALIPARS